METFTPIECLINKLTELKPITGIVPILITEYEKVILVLELIGSAEFDDRINKPSINNYSNSNHDEPNKEPISYFEKFMKAQKNKNNKH